MAQGGEHVLEGDGRLGGEPGRLNARLFDVVLVAAVEGIAPAGNLISSSGMWFAVTNVGGMTRSYNVPSGYNWGWTDMVSGPAVACVHDWNTCTAIG